MNLNDTDFKVKGWNWSFGSLKKNVRSGDAELEQLYHSIQCSALLDPFVTAITLTEDNSHFIVSIKKSTTNDIKILQNFASVDANCANGSISPAEYFIDIIERPNVTMVVTMTSEFDSRYNYREYCGIRAVNVVEGCGLDPEATNADYQIAFTLSDHRDVFVDAPSSDIFRVGAVEIDDDQRCISPMQAAIDAASTTRKIKGNVHLKTTVRNAMKRSRRRRK